MRCTNIKTKTNKFVSGCSVFFEQEKIIALQVDLKEMGFSIVASCFYDNIPSVLLGNKKSNLFEKITFLEYKGYRVWSCDMSRLTLRVCLVQWN